MRLLSEGKQIGQNINTHFRLAVHITLIECFYRQTNWDVMLDGSFIFDD